MESGDQNMNNEVESYVGELRELRAREVKLALLITRVEEHVQGGFEGNNGQVRAEEIQRMLLEPAISDWLDKLRRENRAPFRRYPGLNNGTAFLS